MAAPQSVLILPLVFVHLPPTQSSIPMALPWRSAGSRIQTRILSRNAPLRSSVYSSLTCPLREDLCLSSLWRSLRQIQTPASGVMAFRRGRSVLSDQLTGEQLPIVDRQLVISQNFSRQQSHTPSAKSKARRRTNLPTAAVSVGDLVFLKGDRDKLKAREKYLVVNIHEDLSCELRKFTTSQFRSKL